MEARDFLMLFLIGIGVLLFALVIGFIMTLSVWLSVPFLVILFAGVVWAIIVLVKRQLERLRPPFPPAE